MKKTRQKINALHKHAWKIGLAAALIFLLSFISIATSDVAEDFLGAPSNDANDIHVFYNGIGKTLQQVTDQKELATYHDPTPCASNQGISGYTNGRQIEGCTRVRP